MTFKKKSTPGIRKSTPPNEWFRNAARSMKMASLDLVQSITPATGEFLADNAEYAKSISESLKDARRNNKPLTDMLNVGTSLKQANQIIKNAKDDLRSGNFYNTSRMADAMNDEMGMGDDDYDVFDIEGDLFNDEEDSTTVVNKKTQVNVVSTTAPVIKALEGNAKTTINAAEAIMGANKNIAERTISVSQKTSVATLKGLESINDNLSLMVNFQNDSMTKYIGASIKYYDESINELKQTTAAMLRAYPVAQENVKKKKTFDIFGAYGGLNLQEYGNQIKHNLKNSSNELVMMANMVLNDETFLEALIDSPLKQITQTFAKKLIPASTQALLDNFDQTFASFAPAMMMKLNRWKSSDNPGLQLVADLFGVKTNTKSSIDTKAYHKGALQWDGTSKRALEEVIPRHLSAIESAITGQGERMFDYQKGQWSSVDDMRKELDKRTREVSMSGYSDLTGEMREILNGIKFESRTERENIDNHINNFFTEMTKRMDSQVNFNKLNEMTDLYDFGGDSSMASFIQSLILNSPKNMQMAAAGSGQLQSREALRKFYEELEKNPSLYNAGLLSSNAGLNARMETDDNTKKLVAKKGMGISSIDRYGKDNLDYLRDILVTLQSGIITFNDNGGGGGKKYSAKNSRDYKSEFEARILKREKEEEAYQESQKEKIKADFTYKEESEARQGNIVTSDLDTLLLDYGGADNAIKSSLDLKSTTEGEKKETLIRKYGNKVANMLSGESQKNFNSILDKVDDLVNQPAKLLKTTFDKIDASMYNMVFGTKSNGERSMLAVTMSKLQDMFSSIGDYAKDKIFKPVSEFFLGQNGIWARAKENPIAKSMGEGIKKFFAGGVNEKGEYEPGAFGGVKDSLNDMKQSTIHMLTGKGYTDSSGNKHDDDNNSVTGLFKSGAKTMLIETKKYITGDKDSKDPDKQKGAYGDIATTFKDSITDWSEALFGPKDKSELKKEASKSFAEVRHKIGKGMPKAVVGGIAGGALATGLVSAMGPLGVMGAAILPGGPLGFALAGAAIGMGTQSNRFMDWAFGVENDNGKRSGGAILQASHMEFLKKHKTTMIGGAAVGGAANLLGFGVLPSFLGPAGPLGAALIGAAGGIVLRSDKAQNFLFGPKDADGKRMGGAFSKIFSPITNKMKNGQGKDTKKHLMNMGIGAGGGLALGTAISSLGLMGAMFSPAAPVGLAVAGLAAGMSLSSEKWKKFMFGEWTEDGDRKGGLAQKFTNWSQLNIMDPMKMKVTETISDMNFWFKDTVIGSLKYSFAPIKDAAVFAGKDLMGAMKGTGKLVNTMVIKPLNVMLGKPINDNIIKPVGAAIQNSIVEPLKFITSKSLDVTKGLFKGIAGLPFKMAEGTAMLADRALMARGVAFGAGRNVRNIITGRDAKDQYDENGNLLKGKSRGQSLKGLFSFTEHGANAWSADGANGMGARMSERLADYAANREQRKQEMKEQRAERKLWRGRKNIADVAGYDSFDQFDNDNKFIFNTSKNNASFQHQMSLEGGADKYNEKLKKMYGVSANELLELSGNRDITKITKGQRKDLSRKLKRADKLNLRGDDLLSALGVQKVKDNNLENKASEATIQIAENTSQIVEAIKEDKGFNIENDSHADKLKYAITSAMREAMNDLGNLFPDPNPTPVVESPGVKINETSLESSDDENNEVGNSGNKIPKSKRKKKKFFRYLKDNMASQGFSAFGKRVSLYEDEEEGYNDIDQDELRTQVRAKMNITSKSKDTLSLTDALMSLSEGIPVRVVNTQQFGSSESGNSDKDSSNEGRGFSGVKSDTGIASKRSTSTMGLGTLISKVGNLGSGVLGGIGRAVGGLRTGGVRGMGASVLGGSGLGSLATGALGMLNQMSVVSNRIGSTLDAAYGVNRASKLLKGSSAGTSAQATDSFNFVNDGTSEISQRQNFSKRRNVNEFLSKKAQEDSAMMESKFKHANIDILSQISANTRMIAELTANSYDLDHGFYTWLRNWLENFNPCCGGITGGGGGPSPYPVPIPIPIPEKVPEKVPDDKNTDNPPATFEEYLKKGDKNWNIEDLIPWLIGGAGLLGGAGLASKWIKDKNKDKDKGKNKDKDKNSKGRRTPTTPILIRGNNNKQVKSTTPTVKDTNKPSTRVRRTQTGPMIGGPTGGRLKDVTTGKYVDVDPKRVIINQPEDNNKTTIKRPTEIGSRAGRNINEMERYLSRSQEEIREKMRIDDIDSYHQSKKELQRQSRDKEIDYKEYEKRRQKLDDEFERKYNELDSRSKNLYDRNQETYKRIDPRTGKLTNFEGETKKPDKVRLKDLSGKEKLKTVGKLFTGGGNHGIKPISAERAMQEVINDRKPKIDLDKNTLQKAGKSASNSTLKSVIKSGVKSGAKVGLGVATGGLATLAFGAMDGYDGYKNAASYLGKDEGDVTKADRVGAGATRAVMGGIPFADAIDQAFFNGKVNEKLMEVSTGVTNGVANLSTKLGETWGSVGTTISDKTEGIKTAASEKWESMKTTASTKWESAKATVSEKTEGIRSAASEKFESMRSTATEKWESARETVSTKTAEIASTAKTKFESAVTEVSTTLKDFGTTIGTVASNIGGKIKGLLDIDTTTISSYVGDFGATIGGIASSITGKIESLARKGLDFIKGNGEGPKVNVQKNVGGSPNSSLESLMNNESKSFLNKVDSLKPNIANIKPKKNTFGKGGSIEDMLSDPSNQEAFGLGGKDVYYSQKDSKWGSKSLGGGSTMSTSGCGPTAASMVISSMTDKDINPVEAADFAKQRGHIDPSKGVSSDLFNDIGRKNGVSFSQMKPEKDNIEKALKGGNQLILRGQGNGDFTDSGHYVVAHGLTKDGNVKIKDPLGKNRSGSKPLDRILKGTTHAFEATTGNGDGKNILPKVAYGKGSAFTNPAPGAKLTSPFGYRDIGDGRGKHFHFGIDLAKSGTVPIQAVADGEVTKAEHHSTYGNVVIIKHTIDGKRMDSVYAHLRANMQVRLGEKVKQGQVVGYMGNTGRSFGQHLHFEIHDGPYTYKGSSSPTAIDPKPLVMGGSTATPNPFYGSNGGSNASTGAAKSQADTLMDKFNSMFKTPEAYLQLEHAMDIGTKNLLFGTDDEIGLYNENKGSSNGSYSGSVPTLSGSQVSEKVWNYFKGKGFNTNAIAGIMGNLQQESGMDPAKKQTGGTAKGIAQWEGGRWTKLVNKAASLGVSEWDLPIQLQHIWDELNGEDPTTKSILDKQYGGVSGLQNSKDYKWATEAFEKSFERAGKPMYEKRYGYAQQYLDMYTTKANGVGGPVFEAPDFDIDLYNNNQNVGGPIGPSEFNSNIGNDIKLDARFDDFSVDMDEAIEKQQESERVVFESFGNGDSTLTRKDVDEVLSYLSRIATNTQDNGVRVIRGNGETKESTSKKHADKNADTIPASGKGGNGINPNQRPDNNNMVDQRTYNRIRQVGRGRRN